MEINKTANTEYQIDHAIVGSQGPQDIVKSGFIRDFIHPLHKWLTTPRSTVIANEVSKIFQDHEMIYGQKQNE